MMQGGTHVAVWLHDGAARVFLGAPAAEAQSRWVVYGRVENIETPHIGFWICIDKVEERRPDGKRVEWRVMPPTRLIRWEFVITAQLLSESRSEAEIGFRPTT